MPAVQKIFNKKNLIAFISILFICVMFIFYIIFLWNDTKAKIMTLPILPIEPLELHSEETILAYDISEIDSGNPWKQEWNMNTLPVFYNKNNILSYDEKMNDKKEKMKYLQKIAKKFGVLKNYVMSYDIEQATLENENILLCASNHSISIYFKKNIVLSCCAQQQNKEQAEKMMSLFLDAYKNHFGWQEAKEAISFQYDSTGKGVFQLSAYEKGDTLEQQLLNYHFNKIVLYHNQEKINSLIWTKADLSEKIGDYPIITVEQAEKLLYEGKYISASEQNFIHSMPIVKTELVYRSENLFMPYYKFFVQMPNINENGFHEYSAYYVPAIQQQYLQFKS